MSIFTVNTALQESLAEFGLSDKEALLYLCLADSGKTTANILSRRAGLSRTTVYFVLENLYSRGFALKEQKKGSTYYSANPPSILSRVVEREREELKKKELLAKTLDEAIAPLFKSRLYHVPTLQFFEGKDNVESMLYSQTEEWWRSVDEYDEPFWGYQDHELLEQYREWVLYYWKTKRENQRIRVFSNQLGNLPEGATVPNREIKLLSDTKLFSSNIWVAGEYLIVLMHKHKPQYAFQIRDRVLASNLALIFELLWNNLPATRKSSRTPGKVTRQRAI